MKVFRNIALIILIISVIVIVGCCCFYNYQLKPTSNSEKIVEVDIPSNTSVKEISNILKEKGLIRDKRIFLIYTKIFKSSNLKAGYYEIPYNMGVEKIVTLLEEGSKKSPDEIKITFQEGIHMRDIAKIIASKTVNSYDDVLEKSNDEVYIQGLIEKYWFLSDEVNNSEIYYKLEGYLFPETYYFDNKEVGVEEIFNRMLDKMKSVLDLYKSDIEKSSLSPHQLLTLSTMAEKEAARDKDRAKVARVFLNRINLGMSLGSDVTTRYACKVDNRKQALTKKQYNMKSLYNTRLTDGSMNGKLPIGPICSPSKKSIEAAIYPSDIDDVYFIANIKTLETFYFNNRDAFEQKKSELASVNGGF